MKRVKKILVLCRKYNSSRNVIFMMNETDTRVGNGNYSKFADGRYKDGIFTTKNGPKFTVFTDWSATPRTLADVIPIDKEKNKLIKNLLAADLFFKREIEVMP